MNASRRNLLEKFADLNKGLGVAVGNRVIYILIPHDENYLYFCQRKWYFNGKFLIINHEFGKNGKS